MKIGRFPLNRSGAYRNDFYTIDTFGDAYSAKFCCNADDKESSSNFGVSQLNKLGGKIDGLEPPSGIVFFGNVITCAASITCIGTNNDDIIYSGAREQVFALNGDDIVYGGFGDQAVRW